MNGVSGALLAGGQSRRMGRNKAFIDIPAPDGHATEDSARKETIISRAARVMGSVFDDLFIVANDTPLYEHLGLPIHNDIHIGAGSIAGVHTAVVRAANDLCFVAACDMPRLDSGAIAAVCEAAWRERASYDAFVPFIGGRLHPMHAVYSRSVAPVAEEMIVSGELRVVDLLGRVRTRRLAEEDFSEGGVPISDSVENVNTANELKRLGMED